MASERRAALIAVAIGLGWWWAQSTVPTVGPLEACSVATEARVLAVSEDGADIHRAQLQIWDLRVEGSPEVRDGISDLNRALVSLFDMHRVNVGSQREPDEADLTKARQEVARAFDELDRRCSFPGSR